MAASLADQLMERRAALITKVSDIAQKGVTEGRDLTVEEQTSFDQMVSEADALLTRAKAIKDGEDAAHDLEESVRSATGGSLREKRGEQERAGKLGTWMRSSRVGEVFDVAPVLGSERRAANRATGRSEQRAMSATGGVDQDGVYGQLWEYAVASSQILQAGVDIINTADGSTLPFPVVTAHAATDNTALNPSDTIVESESTITTVDSTVAKYAFLSLVPTELLQDATFDVEGYISRNAGRQLGNRVSTVASSAAVAGFTTAGATAPTGVTTNLGSQSTIGQGSDLLIDLFHSVLPSYRATAAFTMADTTAAIVRKLKTSTGEPVWQAALTAGDPDTILGKGVYIDPNLPTPAASKKIIYFGDWSALKVRIAGGLRFERSADYAFGKDQVAFRAIVRCGAVALDANAVKYLATPAS